jgi:hypothetical protein
MTKRELDSITEQDLDFLTSFIISGPCLIGIKQVPKLIDICDSLRERFGISCGVEIDEVGGYYYVDAGFGNMEVIGGVGFDAIEDSRPLIKYLKEHGSGKYNADLDQLVEEQEDDERLGRRYPYQIELDLEFVEEDMEQLPSFLYFGKENEDGYIEVKSIRDDISGYYGGVSASYYYQP